jgi:hypothetical protein
MRRLVILGHIPLIVPVAGAQRVRSPDGPPAVRAASDSAPTVLPTIVGVRRPVARDTVVVRPLYITAAGPVTVAQPAGADTAGEPDAGPTVVEVPVLVPVWPYPGRVGWRRGGHVRERVERREPGAHSPVLAPPPGLAPAPALPEPPRLPH